MSISVAKDFSATPGGRYEVDGKWSGEQFRRELIEPKLSSMMKEGGKVRVYLDGTAGYATSFLEEAFGGLVREFKKPVSSFVIIETENEVRRKEVEKYIADEEKRLK